MGAETNSPGSRSWFRGRWPLAAAVILLLALVSALLTATLFAPKGNSAAAAPGFDLLDQQGRPTTLAQFHGKIVVLTFIDPYCTQICPLTTQSMVEALRRLGPGAAANVQLVGIDANPDKTKVSDVAAYTRAHDLEGHWLFLTGTLPQLKKVWSSYHVYVASVDKDVVHQAVVYLIGPGGHERGIFSTPMSYGDVGEQAQMLAKAIARLLPSRSARLHNVSLQPNSPLAPDETVDLPALGTGHADVALGKTHAHLLCFFATWLGETANLPDKLAGLDEYGKLARREGWPAPVAVDELVIETSPAAARKLLVGMAATLRTPIVEDAGGHLADGYQVDELPWYVLTSPSGKIIWRHDGWLTPSGLIAGVRGALAAK